ncbi:protein TRANSPARENT TESTA 9 isoform X2 [Arachis hypogaea]|uniref:protein TRANSPARENT TESTA 9 isoform X2 n=1 Tax=Arachis hypogaea TaxID=3818 RepID=UPI003B20D56B
MLCGNVVKYGTQNPDDYCFSNGYINSIILHPYELDGGDLAPYYMSFLRAVSGKINRDTLCLLVNVHGDAVVSFPLYTEALRFAHHEEKMIQTVVRTIALNIYNVSDEMVYKFIMTPPVSDYFSVMVGRLREMCIPLDAFLHEKRGSDLSAITSLYILSRLLQVVGGRSMINNVAGVILYHVLNLNARTLSEGNASDSSGVISISSWCIVLD